MGPIAVVGIVALMIVGVGVGGYMVHEEYVPMMVEPREPNKAMVSEELIEYEHQYKKLLSEIPNLENIEYELYLSSDNLSVVKNDYKMQLRNKGYTYYPEYSGVKPTRGIIVVYDTYIKGLTAVVIGMASAYEFGGDKDNTVVLYTTGYVSDYQAVLDWYNKQN